MKVNINGKKLELKVKTVSPIGTFTGLMFRTSKTSNLLFEFKDSKIRAIHSYFVFFPFLALWLDNENNIIETSLVKPFTASVRPQKPIKKLIEVPYNSQNKDILKLIVGEGKI